MCRGRKALGDCRRTLGHSVLGYSVLGAPQARRHDDDQGTRKTESHGFQRAHLRPYQEEFEPVEGAIRASGLLPIGTLAAPATRLLPGALPRT